ncbi:MAG: CDP-glycerol glycerophosphotransferase family protein [Marmoricola sp.]
MVTVSGAQRRFLDETLDSIRAQTHPRCDVRVLAHGPDEEVGSLPAARALALGGAGAPFLRLVEAGDTFPPGSTAALLAAIRARRRGSAAMAAGRSVPAQPNWRDLVFAQPGTEPGLADRLIDVRRWRASPPALPGTRFADALLVAADARLGCLPVDAVVHHDHARAAGQSFGHVRRWAAEADDWLDAVDGALGSGAGPALASAVLDRRLRALLEDTESLTDEQWARLVDVTRRLRDRADRDLVRVESRAFAWLVAHDQRERVVDLVVSRWRMPHDLPTEVRDGEVYAVLPDAELPAGVRRLGVRESAVATRLHSRSRSSVELVAFIRGVETTEPPQVRVTTADGTPLNVDNDAGATATRLAAEAEHNHDHAWFTVERPPSRGPQTWWLELTSHGVTRVGTVRIPPGDHTPPPHTDPRPDTEIGPYAQRQLQRWYAGEDRIDPDLAYFQCYTGGHASDSPLPIHAALRRMRPDIRTRWLVDNPDVPVPEGAEPVLLRSRAWYETLASAHWLVTNIEMEYWFRRKPGQELLQTFHGNPGKSMGLSAWRAAGFTARRVEWTLDHGPRNWTMLVSPSPEMTVHYREQFAYDGPVADHGYPRDDVLVGPDAMAIRRRTRAALGVAPSQRAVLYAPTWREEQATNYRRARLHDGFDVPEAAAALGEDYVVLLRGHRFHRDLDVSGARVVDVTEHPEVNDLILAADAAVLDYSSIRFDFALTDRPMVFCVPDLEEYAGGRGFLYDFRESAPGPLVSTTADAVVALRDLDALHREYASARDAFHQRFNRFQDGHSSERVVAAFFGTR